MAVHVTEPTAGVLAQLPAWVTLVRAPNPGPMTLDGTNTWVLHAPGGEAVVIDPGPDDEGHLRAVAEAGRIRTVITTHHHADHTAGVPRLLDLCPDARVWSADGALEIGGLELRCIPTPGHTADSITLVAGLGDERVVLTGDTILGRGTTVIAHFHADDPNAAAWGARPGDGDLGEYLASLRLLELLGPLPVLPGHGPALTDCGAAAAYYLRHRLARLDQVRAALAGGARTAEQVVEIVYADVDRALWPAAESSVRAQLAYLKTPGGESTPAAAPLQQEMSRTHASRNPP